MTVGEYLPRGHVSYARVMNPMRDDKGRFSRRKILAHAFRHPSLFPKLIDLNRRAKNASTVLGDFVASCQF